MMDASNALPLQTPPSSSLSFASLPSLDGADSPSPSVFSSSLTHTTHFGSTTSKKPTRFLCRMCQKRLSIRNRARHMRKHGQLPLSQSCYCKCGCFFSRSDACLRHMKKCKAAGPVEIEKRKETLSKFKTRRTVLSTTPLYSFPNARGGVAYAGRAWVQPPHDQVSVEGSSHIPTVPLPPYSYALNVGTSPDTCASWRGHAVTESNVERNEDVGIFDGGRVGSVALDSLQHSTCPPWNTADDYSYRKPSSISDQLRYSERSIECSYCVGMPNQYVQQQVYPPSSCPSRYTTTPPTSGYNSYPSSYDPTSFPFVSDPGMAYPWCHSISYQSSDSIQQAQDMLPSPDHWNSWGLGEQNTADLTLFDNIQSPSPRSYFPQMPSPNSSH